MAVEWYKKHRPQTTKEVIGQDSAVQALRGLFAKGYPQTTLLVGASGCGKTTLARIVANRLGIKVFDAKPDPNFKEINCADFRGIDMVRDIRSRYTLAALGGKCRVYLIDEVHRLTNEAQDAFLKMTEDTPTGVYFIFATTEPEKLRETFKSRCFIIPVQTIKDKDMRVLVETVADKEGLEVSDDVLEKLVEVAGGNARRALVLLQKVAGLPGEPERLQALIPQEVEKQAIELARVLIKPRPMWGEVTPILKALKGEDPEGLRRLVLAYATTVLLGGGKLGERAYLILNAFESNLYSSGFPGLVRAAYEVCSK